AAVANAATLYMQEYMGGYDEGNQGTWTNIAIDPAPYQTVDLMVSGGELITGAQIYIHIGNGDLVKDEPSFFFAGIDFSGGIFDDGRPVLEGGAGPWSGYEMYLDKWLAFTVGGDAVAANGKIATLTIDGAGYGGGSFPIVLTDGFGTESALIGAAAALQHGLIQPRATSLYTTGWEGDVSTDWSEPTNWGGDVLPSSTTAAWVNTDLRVAHVTGSSEARALIIEGGDVLVESGGQLQVADKAFVVGSSLTVENGGTFSAVEELNTAGTTDFQAGATVDVPLINVTGGATTIAGGVMAVEPTINATGGTATGSNTKVTTLVVAGGTVNGSFISSNTTTPAFEIESGTVNATLGPDPGAPTDVPSLRKSGTGTAALNGVLTLDSMSVETGTLNLGTALTIDSISVAAGATVNGVQVEVNGELS
ncbi:unnamed protein product, partial [marine sediment metagenome]